MDDILPLLSAILFILAFFYYLIRPLVSPIHPPQSQVQVQLSHPPPQTPQHSAPLDALVYQEGLLLFQMIRPPVLDLILACHALSIWHQIAVKEKMRYMIVGSVAASMNHEGNIIDQIEILIEENRFDDVKRNLVERHPELQRTQQGQVVILLPGRGNEGVALQVYAAGTYNYPDRFIPPYNSPSRKPEHDGLEPTYQVVPAVEAYPNLKILIIQSKLGLKQRLLRFDLTSTCEVQKWRNENDIYEIKAFLKGAARDEDGKFNDADVQQLKPQLARWLMFVKTSGVKTLPWEIQQWALLGLDVRNEYVTPIRQPAASQALWQVQAPPGMNWRA
jgi:hypothetical protein